MSKKAPKAAAVVAKAVEPMHTAEMEKAWKDLALLLKNQDDVKHDQVQKLAEKIFHSSVLSGSADAEALEVLSVSLLQQSRWGALVALLGAHPTLVGSNAQLAFHFAYALYRDKQHTKSLDELRKRGATTDGALHLQAQANYRAGQYGAAAAVYRDTRLASDDDVELQANMLAALVSAGLLEEARAYMTKLDVLANPASFELAYNATCGLIEAGEFEEAITLLRKAQVLCRSLLEEEELTEAEVDNEMAVLLVQEAFLLQAIGATPSADGTENDRALAIYTKVLTHHPSDPNVVSLASNNLLALRTGAGRVWDSLKKSSKAVENLDLKDMTLSMRQKSAIQLNRALALFHGKQYDKCRDLLASVAKEFPANVQHAIALAAVLARDKSKAKEAEDVLNVWLRANEKSAPVESVRAVHLGLAHLALVKGDIAAAASIIVALAQTKAGAVLANRPAYVATIVALYERAGNLDAAHAAIQSAVQSLREAAAASNDAASTRAFQLVLSSASAWYNLHGRESDAAALLELLSEQTTSAASGANRGESLARLVLAYRGDESKAATFVAQLPPLTGIDAFDVRVLETEPAPETKRRATKNKKKTATANTATDAEDDEEEGDAPTAAETSASLAKAAARKALRAKKKRTKVPRYPKGFDPANPGPMPDPERWLPRWERSNQKKYKRRTGNAIRGAQGSTNTANMPTKEAEASHDSLEMKGKMSGAAAAAARKRAGKKR